MSQLMTNDMQVVVECSALSISVMWVTALVCHISRLKALMIFSSTGGMGVDQVVSTVYFLTGAA